MKTYTDIKQSKKLQEILSIESADMCYQKLVVHSPNNENNYYMPFCFNSTSLRNISCWSIGALLDAIKFDYRIEKSQLESIGKFTYSIWLKDSTMHTGEYDELIDACIEIIYKLAEEGLI